MTHFFLNNLISWVLWVPFWALVAIMIWKRNKVINWLEQQFGEMGWDEDELP